MFRFSASAVTFDFNSICCFFEKKIHRIFQSEKLHNRIRTFEHMALNVVSTVFCWNVNNVNIVKIKRVYEREKSELRWRSTVNKITKSTEHKNDSREKTRRTNKRSYFFLSSSSLLLLSSPLFDKWIQSSATETQQFQLKCDTFITDMQFNFNV